MLYAKISPAAQVVKQKSPFEVETVEVDHIIIFTETYILGWTKDLGLRVNYVEPVRNEEGKLIQFKDHLRAEVKLSPEEFADWGTDDKFIFEAVAANQGFTILEFIEEDFYS